MSLKHHIAPPRDISGLRDDTVSLVIMNQLLLPLMSYAETFRRSLYLGEVDLPDPLLVVQGSLLRALSDQAVT